MTSPAPSKEGQAVGATVSDAEVEATARSILRAEGMDLFVDDDQWAKEMVRHRERAERFGDLYLNSRSYLTDAFRHARIALEAAAARQPHAEGAAAAEIGGLEPPGCPIPGECACPGGEGRLAERLGQALRRAEAAERTLVSRDAALRESQAALTIARDGQAAARRRANRHHEASAAAIRALKQEF